MPRRNDQPTAVRQAYEQYGAPGYYQRYGATYRNPHEPIIAELLGLAVARWQLPLGQVLDLACGSGEATLVLRALGAGTIAGIDPYTSAAYVARTGQPAEQLDFEQIAAGALMGRHYDLIVCSFALHLVPLSRLPGLAVQLSLLADTLLILTPHKRPELQPAWGWTLRGELLHQRVRARYYERA